MSAFQTPEHDVLWSLDGYLRDEDEGRALAHLASRVPRGLVIVEIGSFKGKPTCFLAAGSKMGSRVPVYAVDLWDLDPENPPGIRAEFDAQVVRAGMERVIVPIRGESTQVAHGWQHDIGLLFIDGSHDLHAVTADFEAWSPMVVDSGIVAFHGYHPRFPGVIRLVDETVRRSDDWTGFQRYGQSLVSVVRKIA